MRRLSWITFIFLHLTFVTGIFGMNVDTFKDNSSLKGTYVSCNIIKLPFDCPILLLTLDHHRYFIVTVPLVGGRSCIR
jgi:hypothetical protein